MFLLWVIGDAVEFQRCIFLHRHTFPVAEAEGALFTGKLPIEITMIGIHLTAKEQRGDVDAVGLGNGFLATRQCGKGGHKVREVHLIADLSGWYATRLIHDQRHFDAPFIKLTLPALESCVTIQFADGCHHRSAIVGGEDDEGVLA